MINSKGKRNIMGIPMTHKLAFILVCFLSWPVLAKNIKTVGCASLVHKKEVALKIALIRAKASWVEHHYGGVVSGRETLLLDNDTTQLAQTIKVQGTGLVPSQPILQVNNEQRVKDIDGKPFICVYLSKKR